MSYVHRIAHNTAGIMSELIQWEDVEITPVLISRTAQAGIVLSQMLPKKYKAGNTYISQELWEGIASALKNGPSNLSVRLLVKECLSNYEQTVDQEGDPQ